MAKFILIDASIITIRINFIVTTFILDEDNYISKISKKVKLFIS